MEEFVTKKAVTVEPTADETAILEKGPVFPVSFAKPELEYDARYSLEHVKKIWIIGALRTHKRKVDAAKALGMNRRTLYRYIAEYGIREKHINPMCLDREVA